METILKVEYAVDDEDFKCVLEQINLFFVWDVFEFPLFRNLIWSQKAPESVILFKTPGNLGKFPFKEVT
jgi:hypothetical protein